MNCLQTVAAAHLRLGRIDGVPVFHRVNLRTQFIGRINGKCLVGCLLASLAISGTGVSGSQVPDKRSITVEDCVRTRRIVPGEVKISLDGKELAYVVKSPDPRTNRNNYILYVRSLGELERRDNGRKLLEADSISGIRWMDTGRLAARVEQIEGTRTRDRLIIVEPSTGAREMIECPKGAQDYSMTPDERIIVFSTVVSDKPQEPGALPVVSADQQLRGYVIPFRRDHKTFGVWIDSEIKVYRRTGKDHFEISKLWFTGPEGLERRSMLPNIDLLNLSPDGKYLLFEYWTDKLPKDWEELPVVRQLRAIGSGARYVFALCEMSSGRIRWAFNSAGGFIQKTAWAADSRSYAVVSPSPFGSTEGNDEERAAAASGNEYFYLYRFGHVFTIDVSTGQVTRVLSRDSGKPGDSIFRYDGPLAWKKSQGDFILRTGVNEFARMNFKDGEWKEAEQFEFAGPGTFGSSFASDGETLVGISESPNTPPDIRLVDIGSRKQTLLTNLNPDYEHIEVGEIQDFRWTNRYGSRSEGELIKPVGYEPGKRYPLVIMGTNFGHEFVTAGAYFAPQSLANAGFVVLLTGGYPIDRKIPPGQYPGEMSEAFNYMAMVESAIDLLSKEGMIDTDRVGIAGFSRSSFLTDFTLSHSTYHFRAASSADGGAYEYAEYTTFLDMAALLGHEAMMGGPPYGETLKNWLDYAAPFSASHIHTPLLMEYTIIDSAKEMFTMLNRQEKPVELYFYPHGHHPLDTPFERVSSLQRNVDWFRFWLQGYERPGAEDPQQYTRWRAFRAMQEAEK